MNQAPSSQQLYGQPRGGQQIPLSQPQPPVISHQCRFCGAEMRPNESFCPNCGTQLASVPQQAVQNLSTEARTQPAAGPNQDAMRGSQGIPSLEVTSNIPSEKLAYDLTKPVINIGRDPSNDLVIDAPVVSHFHTQIVHEGNQLLLIHPPPSQSHTTNGLLYQGRHILGKEPFRKPLARGDIFRIGNEHGALVTLTYHDGSGDPQQSVPEIRPVPGGAPVSTPGSQSPHPQAQPPGKQQEQANHYRSRSRRDLSMPESIDTSLVRIHTKAGGVAGAGFLVSERHILTCAHVIEQALGLPDDASDPRSSTVSLDFPLLASHTQLTAQVVFWCPVQADGRGDMAGLELLDTPPAGAAAVHFAPAEQVWGHPYRAFGFPAGQDDGVWSDGRLLGQQGTNWIQLEDDKIPGFAVIAGFSGAPVWDEQLQGVVGMIVASSQPATTKTAFAIPSDVLIASWLQLASLMLPPVPRNPYKGLRAFTEHDTRDFFGRETLIDAMATEVETALTREQQEGQQARLLTVVLGPSGSGKSSVVMAGLLPCLQDGRVLNSQEWVYLDPVFPGAHPLEALAVSLAKQLPNSSVVSLHNELASASARILHLLVCQLVASSQQRAVLVVDQFEEVFTLTTDEAERRQFFELLVTAVTEPRGPLFVILTLRADFYDCFIPWAARIMPHVGHFYCPSTAPPHITST